MKKIYLLACLVAWLYFPVNAQDSLAKVEWKFTGEKKSDNRYLLSFNASIQPGWKLFSTTATDDEPNTRIQLDSSTASSASISSIKENGKLQQKSEPVLDNINIKYFEDKVEIQVEISANKPVSEISGDVNFMAIKGDEVTGPDAVPFRFQVNANGITAKKAGLQESTAAAGSLKRNAIKLDSPVNSCGGTGTEDKRAKSLWGIFILGFLGG